MRSGLRPLSSLLKRLRFLSRDKGMRGHREYTPRIRLKVGAWSRKPYIGLMGSFFSSFGTLGVFLILRFSPTVCCRWRLLLFGPGEGRLSRTKAAKQNW